MGDGGRQELVHANVGVEYVSQLAALLYKNLIMMTRSLQATLILLLGPAASMVVLGLALNLKPDEVGVLEPRQVFGGNGDGLLKCMVFDVPGGRYGLGGVFPDADCITISYSPQAPQVDQVMLKMAELNGLNFGRDFKGYASSHAMAAALMAEDATPTFGAIAFDNRGTLSFPFNEAPHAYPGINPINSLPIDLDQHILPYEVWYNSTVAKLALFKYAGIDRLSESLPKGSRDEIVDVLIMQRAVNEAILATHVQVGEASLEVRLKDFPLEDDPRDKLVKNIENFAVGIVLMFGVVACFVVGLRQMLQEKEDRLLDALRMMGLYESCYWISWLFHFCLHAAISCALVVAAGRFAEVPVFVHTDSSLMWTLLFLFMSSMSSFAMALSSFLPSVRFGMSIGGMLMFLAITFQFYHLTQDSKIHDTMFDPYRTSEFSQNLLKLYTPVTFTKVMNNMIMYSAVHGSYTWDDAAAGYYQFLNSMEPNRHSKNVSDEICTTEPICKASFPSCNIDCENVVCTDEWRAAASRQECIEEGGKVGSNGSCLCLFSLESDLDTMYSLASSTLFFTLLAWYLGQIFTHGHSKAEKPWFPLTPWYWIPGAINHIICMEAEPTSPNSVVDDEDVLREAREVLSGERDEVSTYPVVLYNLVKDFGSKFTWGHRVRAVNGVNLGLRVGECFALLGHNGAGKSTLINMLCGMTSISGGDCLVLGSSVRDNTSSIRHNVSVCPQHDILWSELTAREHLMFYGLFQGMSIDTVRQQSNALLRHVHLDMLTQRAKQYSGGMRRRLSVTIAALGNKRIVFLDEPTTGLDPQNQQHVWDLIHGLKQDRVVVLTTHLMEEAEILGDRVGIMSEGNLIALGSPLHLKAKFGGTFRAKVFPSKGSESNRELIASQVSSLLPRFEKKVIPQTGSLEFELNPFDLEQAPELFHLIDTFRANGVAENWELRQTTLKDVFVFLDNKVKAKNYVLAEDVNIIEEEEEEEQEEQGEGEEEAGSQRIVPIAEEPDLLECTLRKDTREYHKTHYLELRALLLKSFVVQQRQVLTVVFQLLVPAALLVVCFRFSGRLISDLQQENPNEPFRDEFPYFDGAHHLSGEVPFYTYEVGHNDVMVGVSAPSLKDVVGGFSKDEALVATVPKALECTYKQSFLHGFSCRVREELRENLTSTFVQKQGEATGLLRHFPVGLFQEKNLEGKTTHTFVTPVLRPIASYPDFGDLDDPELAIDTLMRQAQSRNIAFGNRTIQEQYDKIREVFQESFPSSAMIFHNVDILSATINVTIQSYLDGFPSSFCVPSPLAIGAFVCPRHPDAGPVDGKLHLSKAQYLLNGLTSALLAANESPASSSPLVNATKPVVLVGTKAFPYSEYARNVAYAKLDAAETLDPVIISALLFATILLLPVLVSHLVHEKEHKLRPASLMMGMDIRMFWLAHYCFDLILVVSALLIIYIMCVVIQVEAFSKHEFGIVLVLLLLWANALIALAFFFSLFFSHARNANIVMYILVLISSGAPLGAHFFIFWQTPTISAPLWWVWFPPFAYSRAITLLAYRTFIWSDLSSSSELVQIWGYLFLATLLLFVSTIYFDQVLPKEHGVRRDPLFCLQGSCHKTKEKREDGDHARDAQADPARMLSAFEDPDVAQEYELVDRRSFESLKVGVQVMHLRKCFGNSVVVEDLCLAFPKGCSALLGPNGAGKSTTLSMLTGLCSPTHGDATIAGWSIRTKMTAIHQVIGVCPQQDVYYPSLTIREHLLFFARLKGCHPSEEDDLVTDSLASVKLLEHGDKYAYQLSGGQLRRMSIAIAFIGDPKVVFLDEPTTGVDPVTRADVHALIMQEKKRRTIVLTTHLMSEAEALCDKIAIMAHGQLRTVGTVSSLKAKFDIGFQLVLWVTDEELALNFIAENFPETELVSEANHKFLFEFGKDTQVSLADVWTVMQSREEAQTGFSNWQISATTLSDVFSQVASESEAQHGSA